MATSASLGFAVYIACGAWRSLWPTRIDWFPSDDPLTHWLGWAFFRHAPLLQWPLGNNPFYGAGLNETIVFSDSIPLLAFLFRPFATILPDQFQYIGIWILICYMLQGILSYILIKMLTKQIIVSILGSILFVTAPIMITRLSGHYALGGHWIILAALCCFFCEKRLTKTWAGLLVTATLIHAYLLAMIVPIWLSQLAHSWLSRRDSFKSILFETAIGLIAIFATASLAGYFSVGQSVATDGYNLYSMNLNSLWNPAIINTGEKGFSSILSVLPIHNTQQIEGAAYLGLGVIVAALLASGIALKKPAFGRIGIKFLVLTAAVLAMACYAVSNEMTYGDDTIFTYSLPQIVTSLASVFRASGRFAWPLVYLITAAAVCVIGTRLRKNGAVAAMGLIVLIQAIDIGPALSEIGKRYVGSQSNLSLSDPLWNTSEIMSAKHIAFVRASNKAQGWEKLSLFAAKRQMSINVGYFARIDAAALDEQQIRLAQTVWSGDYDPSTVYVFNDDKLWVSALYSARTEARFFIADGYRVMVPFQVNCALCSQVSRPIGPPPSFLDGIASEWAFQGWNQSEGTHRWSEGDQGRIIAFVPRTDAALCLLIKGYTLGEQTVGISVDGVATDHVVRNGDVSLNIPLGKEPGRRTVTLTFSNPHSPGPNDERLLALDLLDLSLQTCN